MGKVLIIDDERTAVNWIYCDVVHARNPINAIKLLRLDVKWDVIMFDHDLGKDPEGNHYNVLDVVDFMNRRAYLQEPIEVKRILVHSMNPAGADNIVRGLERFYGEIRELRRIPLPSTLVKLDHISVL